MSEARFQAPPQEMHDPSWTPYQPALEAAAFAAGGPAREVYEAIATLLARRVAAEGEEVVALALEAQDLQGLDNIVGVGLGAAEGHAATAAMEPSTEVVSLYVIEPMEEEQAREAIAAEWGGGAAAVQYRVVVTGEVHALRTLSTFGRLPAA